MNRSAQPAGTSSRPLSSFAVEFLTPGAKQILEYEIGTAPDGSLWGISILVVRGMSPGPVFLVNGGTHGDEYEGPLAIQEFFRSLTPAELRGTWLGIPVLNEPAMSVGRRLGRYDDQDLARIFPGKPDGTLTERIAYGFGQFVLRQAEYYVDLHSGGNVLQMVFLAGYKLVGNPDVLVKQRKMAVALGADLVWGTPPILRPTLWQAEQFAIPAIYAETTGSGGVRREDVARYVEGVRNVMRSLGLLEGAYPDKPRRYFRETSASSDSNEGYLQIDHAAPCDGLFVCDAQLWDKVEENQKLGEIVDAAGRPLAVIRFRRSGHVIMIRHRTSLSLGDPVAAVVAGLR